MKFWKHLKTINHHKMLVMKGCFRVGLYKQGLLHDLSKYTAVGVPWLAANIIREMSVQTMQKERTGAILPHGFIIKDATNIIWNTGLIMECHRNRRW